MTFFSFCNQVLRIPCSLSFRRSLLQAVSRFLQHWHYLVTKSISQFRIYRIIPRTTFFGKMFNSFCTILVMSFLSIVRTCSSISLLGQRSFCSFIAAFRYRIVRRFSLASFLNTQLTRRLSYSNVGVRFPPFLY